MLECTGKLIAHRDLKPGNVFVRSVDPLDLVLGDFGFARDLAMSSEYMSVVGVFHYTAPEAALGGLASPAGDWWALEIIVYELLTGHSLLLFGVTAFFLVPRGSRLTALIDHATVPVVCIALAFVVESVFRLRPPPVAYWLGFASFLWAGFGTLTSVPASPGPAAGVWLAGLFAWFLGGYAVGYALGFALDRLLGSGRDTTDGRWLVLPAVSVLTVAVARVVAGFGQVGVQLGTAGLGANLAQAAVLPVVRDLPLTIMQPLALFTGFASLVALTTTRATSQLPTGRRRMLWGALNVAAGLVVAYWAPNLVMTLWILLGAALVMGMAAMAISAVTE